MLAELHLHFEGAVPAPIVLEHLARQDRVLWDWYETEYAAVFGSVPPGREILQRHREGDPSALADFERLYVLSDAEGGNFRRFTAKFNLYFAGAAVSFDDASPAQVAAETAEFARGVRDAHIREGVSYAEHRTMLGSDLRLPRNEAALQALLQIYHQPDADITRRLAISLRREDPWADWERVQELALGPYGEALTGIDFCATEEGHPPKTLADFFAAVREFNNAHPERALAILHHVGESFTDKSLESAVRWVQEAAEIGAHRLGHAIALGVDPERYGPHTRTESVAERRDSIAYDLQHAAGLRGAGVHVDVPALDAEARALSTLADDATIDVTYDAARLQDVRHRQDYAMDRVRTTGAVVEVCPTSNRRIGGITDDAHHPVHRFVQAGLPVVVSTDDPGVFATTLNDELSWVADRTGGGSELRQELIAMAWRSRSEVLTSRMPARAASRPTGPASRREG